MAAAVTLTRVAQLENRATSSRFREKGRKRPEDSRERSGGREELRQRPGARNARVLSAISIYFASNLHVSPRVSALFRAQHSCGTPSTPLPFVLSRSPLVSLLFFLYIVARTVGELTRNPLVASTHHPPTTTVSRPNHPRVAVLRRGSRSNLLRKITSLWLRCTVQLQIHGSSCVLQAGKQISGPFLRMRLHLSV